MKDETGIALHEWVECSNEHYHGSAGVGASQLKILAQQSPLHLYTHLTQPAVISATLQATFDFGTQVHMAILEPDRYAETYVVEPAYQRKAGSTIADQREAFAKDNEGKKLTNEKDAAKAAAMAQSVRSQPLCKALLSDGFAEKSAWWRDPDTGVLCKFRPDFVSNTGEYIIDLKTTVDVGNAAFMRQSDNLMYHLQAAHYLKGAEVTELTPAKKFLFIAVEKTPPYAAVVYEASERMTGLGDDWRRYAMQKYSECALSGIWPGPEPAQVLDVPNWAKMPPEY